MKIYLGFLTASILAVTTLNAKEVSDVATSSNPIFSISGEVEAEANVHYKQVDPRSEINNQENETQWLHDYSSTFNLVFSVQFNEKWSAEAAISADDEGTAPEFAFDGAFVKYQANQNFMIKIGDMAYSEGSFRYYDYDDPGDYAIGMMEHNLRGIEIGFYGLTFAAGLGSDDDDCDEENNCRTYDLHAAYDWNLAGQMIRPYINYKSYQETDANQLRTGIVANLVFGEVANIQMVYGLYSNSLTEENPKISHAFAIEPELAFGKFSVKASGYYAILDSEDATDINSPEYAFGYIEPAFAITNALTIGIPLEYHTMSVDSDDKLAQLFVGPKTYLNPVENLSLEAYVRAFIPMGDDYGNEDDPYYGAGASIGFTF